MRRIKKIKKIILFILLINAVTLSANKLNLTPIIEEYNKIGFEAEFQISNLIDEYNTNAVLIDDEKTEEYVSLLNYVFFDYGSAEIPDRYNQDTYPQSRNFNPFAMGHNSVAVYHNILNIIGHRMRKNPDAVLNIIGCTDGVSDEERKPGLGMRRAIAVADYLSSIWFVDDDRINIEGREAPEKESVNQLDSLKRLEEHRRVEFYSDNPAILAPFHNTRYRILQNQFYVDIKDKDFDINSYDDKGYLTVYNDTTIIGGGYLFKKQGEPIRTAIPEYVMQHFLDSKKIQLQVSLTKKDSPRLHSKLYPVAVERISTVDNLDKSEYKLLLLNYDDNKEIVNQYIIDKKDDIDEIEYFTAYEEYDVAPMYNKYESAPDVDYGESKDTLSAVRIERAKVITENLHKYILEKLDKKITQNISEFSNKEGRSFDNQFPECRYYNRATEITIRKK